MGAIIGIDLGTTNSEVAVIRDGRPEIIPVDGEPIMPS
jgi:molecular chaperone DnaK